jgi:glyoxylase-like metal-dependent hydrolase (beta-lactamase superfamily II)
MSGRLSQSLLCTTACLAAFGAGAQAPFEVLPVQGNVFVAFGPGGNSVVQAGHEALVLVDTQTAEAADALIATLREISTKPLRHIVTTSADPAHTGGNEALSRFGTYVRLIDTLDPRGSSSDASIIAHVNVLGRMSAPTGATPAAPEGAWPSDTYFTEEWALFVNGEAVQLLHVPTAFSDGDTMVFFRRSDVLAAGEIFSPVGYPRLDAERGGSVAGIIEGLDMILDVAIAGENQEGGTVVVPGRGRLSDETDVANYRDMVVIVRDRIRAAIEAGQTLEQVQAAKLTRDYDGTYGRDSSGERSAERFVAAVYRELAGGGQ